MERRLTLSSGIEVELQSVPPYVLFKVERELATLPSPPTKEVETAAGVQQVPIEDMNDPRYQEWMEEYRDAESDQMFQKWAAALSHGIKRWRKKPTNALHRLLGILGLGYQWQSEPPDNWELSEDLQQLVGSTGSRRLDYIYFMLLADAEDFGKVFQALMSGSTELTKEEVDDAETSFRNGVAGDGPAEGEERRGAGEDAVLRDGGGEGMGDDTEGVEQEG